MLFLFPQKCEVNTKIRNTRNNKSNAKHVTYNYTNPKAFNSVQYSFCHTNVFMRLQVFLCQLQKYALQQNRVKVCHFLLQWSVSFEISLLACSCLLAWFHSMTLAYFICVSFTFPVTWMCHLLCDSVHIISCQYDTFQSSKQFLLCVQTFKSQR